MTGAEAATKAPRTSLHGHWSSRMAFILAVTGSYKTWRLLARFVAPASIIVIFLQSVGVLG